MIINTAALKKDTITITSKDGFFANTPLAEHDFTITLRPVGRTESINIFLEAVKQGDSDIDIDKGLVAKGIFIASIVSWTGFEDENGNPLPCTDEIKAALWESSEYDTLVAGIQAALKQAQEKKDNFKDNIKKK